MEKKTLTRAEDNGFWRDHEDGEGGRQIDEKHEQIEKLDDQKQR
jgi:hypothetical protein